MLAYFFEFFFINYIIDFIIIIIYLLNSIIFNIYKFILLNFEDIIYK